MCFEHKEGVYVNGSVFRDGNSGISSDELNVLENRLMELEEYEGDFCNIITIKPFLSEEIESADYLIRYLINGTGSFGHVDVQYGAIESLDDIEFLQQKFAEELEVDAVVITDFELIEKE